MASATKKIRLIRKKKLAKKGSVRKRKIKAEGSTRTPAELFGDE